ncbi:hypothetical protein SAMN05421548_10598 [Paraburkholderia lycopersici]|uniref:Uncharacterized protein n=1 Tax=Paraburkholderia lycopersici TaxID=416944 RepID=A0A1G6K4U8_9BURK|nr:hypothetical protein SAMN05421548_10598 [Paraburkholderia lycopersici]
MQGEYRISINRILTVDREINFVAVPDPRHIQPMDMSYPGQFHDELKSLCRARKIGDKSEPVARQSCSRVTEKCKIGIRKRIR